MTHNHSLLSDKPKPLDIFKTQEHIKEMAQYLKKCQKDFGRNGIFLLACSIFNICFALVASPIKVFTSKGLMYFWLQNHFFLFRSCLFSSSLGFSERERDYSIVSISMSQYPITSLEWGSCRELVLLLFSTRILRNNRCICITLFFSMILT